MDIGEYRLRRYHHRPSDSPKVLSVCVSARIDGNVVGYLDAYVLDLRRYTSTDGVILAMDAISQTTYDAAEAIDAMGARYWRNRGILCFLDTAEVAMPHRRRGVARAMVSMALDSARSKNGPVDVLVQPFPLAMETVVEDELNGRSVISREEWDAETSRVVSFWQKMFPFLVPSVPGGLQGDRMYYFGRYPGA